MKIILTEKQLRLIIESESEGKLFTLPLELLEKEDGFIKMSNLYFQNKEKKNYSGIKIVGYLNLDYIEVDLDSKGNSINDLLDEVVVMDGDFSSGDYTEISKFSKLKYANGFFEIHSTKVTELPNLIKVSELSIINTPIKSLPSLERVDKDFYFKGSKIVSIPNLVSVGWSMRGINSKIKSLPKLESVGADYDHEYYKADLVLQNTEIKDLPNLKYVNGDLNLVNTPLGSELKESGMSDEEIKDKFGVQGKLYI